MRVMYDSVTLANCPTDGALYGCYVDSSYKNDAEAARRFPGKRLVKITVTGATLNAHVADVERGDLTPQSGADWAHRRKAAGYHPTLYCNTSTRPAVEAACRAVGLTVGRDVWIWEAHYDGVATLPPNTVAKQYLGDFHGYDKSIVGPYWPGVDPTPTVVHNPYPEPYLPFNAGRRAGHEPERVKWVQWALQTLHLYSGAIDGDCGPMTRAAVIAFKEARHLTVDPIIRRQAFDELKAVHR